eukprot:TRINITY_DN9367_c0_g1_i1.p1 TRINITY_DN9367_c0_g1~~TRINITY_DN9367_c0_g1_i1.p1  ORF type:complete len:234 (-),score=38.87 TRINITY_DN9367_c0_g1_i1:128-829(-)
MTISLSSVLAFVILCPIVCTAATWSILSGYDAVQGCAGGPMWQTMTRISGDATCESTACVNIPGVGGYSTCCTDSEPAPPADTYGTTLRDGTDNCDDPGTLLQGVFIRMNRCVGYKGQYVRYTRVDDATVSVADCSDPGCQQCLATTTIYTLGCATTETAEFGDLIEVNLVGAGSGGECTAIGGGPGSTSSSTAAGSTDGTNNNQGDQPSGGTTGTPELLLVFGALLALCTSV